MSRLHSTNGSSCSGAMSSTSAATSPRTGVVLVTGATGYVGGRLVPALERLGHRVRCLARRPEHLRRARRAARPRSCAATCSTPARSPLRMRGVDVAYYLVHSMGAGGPFEETDRTAAENFGRGRARGRRPADRLPRRARRRAAPTLAASPQPARGRRVLRASRRPGDRVPRLDRHRLRQPLLRDGARPGRAAAGHGDAALGRRSGPADRHRRPARATSLQLSTSPSPAARSSRSAAPTGFVRRHHARVCTPARAPPRHDPRFPC